jgi:hypothetical protein
VTVTPLFTIVIYGAIFEWRCMCTTLVVNDVCSCIELARTVYTHPKWLFAWWFFCQKNRICTYVCVVLANPMEELTSCEIVCEGRK